MKQTRRVRLFPLLITLSATCVLLPSTATCTASLSFVHEDLYARPYYEVVQLPDMFIKETEVLPVLEKKRNGQASDQCDNEKKYSLLESQWSEQVQQKKHVLSPDSFLMRTESDGRFLCTVPRPAHEVSFLADKEPVLSENERLQKLAERGTELLASTWCISYTHGWFTYEYCHGRHIRQYLIPSKLGTKRPELYEYYLGRNTQSRRSGYPKESAAVSPKSPNNHDPMKEDNEIAETEDDGWEEPAQVVSEDGTLYISFLYENGTLCDVTGKPRSAEVHFYCKQGEAEHILQVQEPSICKYIMTIQTPRLCNETAFLPRSINQINCNPII